jgi:glutathione synthase/RimK-type ligase-like ATP-grasp enzyme
LERDVILIVAPHDDTHALAVRRRIEMLYGDGFNVVFFDTATFPIASRVSWETAENEVCSRSVVADPLSLFLGLNAGRILQQRDTQSQLVRERCIHSVWLRRARPVIIDPDITAAEVRDFCQASTTAVLEACLYVFPRVFNRPEMERRAANKPYQLVMANRMGLAVPRTIVTSDQAEAEAFVRNLAVTGRECVYKTVAISSRMTIPTRLVTESDLARLPTMRFAPVTFQERICGGANIRVAIVGRQVFAARWIAEGSVDDPVDIRLDDRAKMWPHQLGEATETALLHLHEALGLIFGIYDLKYDRHGRIYFLEVNPSGQWLDLELESGYPVSETWARVLAEGIDARALHSLAAFDDQTLGELHPHDDLSSVDWVRHV